MKLDWFDGGYADIEARSCPNGHNLERYGTYPDKTKAGTTFLRCRECNKQRAKNRRALFAAVRQLATETLRAEIAAARAEAPTAPLFRGSI